MSISCLAFGIKYYDYYYYYYYYKCLQVKKKKRALNDLNCHDLDIYNCERRSYL